MTDTQTTPIGHAQVRSRTVASRTAALAGLVVLLCLICWLQARSYASVQDTATVAQAQLLRMQQDAVAITQLQQAPKSASGRQRRNEELLTQVERSMDTAGIDRSHWQDSVPLAPKRLARSDYRVHDTRLYLKNITMKQLAGLVYDLQTKDPTLQVAGLMLTDRKRDDSQIKGDALYDVELTLRYRVYAPVSE